MDLHFNFLDFYIGKVEVLKSDNIIEPAEIKKRLLSSDIVRTFEESKAYIQFGDDHIVEVNPNSELAMNILPASINSANEKTELNLMAGKVSISAHKLTSHGELKVKSGNIIIAVRGTVFSIERIGDNLKVDVREGKVSITFDSGVEETIIESGEKAFITDSKIIKIKMNDDDISLFNIIEKIQPIDNIQWISNDFIIDYFNSILKQDKKQKVKSENFKIIPLDKNRTSDAEISEGPRLNINTFTANGIEKNEALEITKIIYSRLVSLKGKDKVIYRSIDGSLKKVNRTLTGRISKLGSVKLVSVNVLDIESGKVLFSQTLKINENDSAQTLLESMADKIISSEKIF